MTCPCHRAVVCTPWVNGYSRLACATFLGTFPVSLTLQDCQTLDRDSPDAAALSALRERFVPGTDGTLHFDGNSIGPMPLAAPQRVAQVMSEGWVTMRRRSWTQFDWLDQPHTLGAALAGILGAAPEDLLVADTTSLNQYKCLRLALAARAPRRVIVLERNVFPSNRYVAEGIARAGLAQLRFIEDASELGAALALGDVAVVALSHVDYRSSTRLDMAALTREAHAAGALALFDLSHSAGAVAIQLAASEVDLAVACGYKYLCGGPGAPSVLYVASHLRGQWWPAICGWMGHADTFAFEPSYTPHPGMQRFTAGTPAVLANAAFSAAADIWRDVPPDLLDRHHASLTDTLIELLQAHGGDFGVAIASPLTHARRGGHIALEIDGAAQLAAGMLDAGVVVSARKPDTLRFGVHPLTTRHVDLWQAVQVLAGLMADPGWRDRPLNASSRI